jgi:hypothetical protein
LTDTGGGYWVEVRITAMPQAGQKCWPPVIDRHESVESGAASVNSFTCSG